MLTVLIRRNPAVRPPLIVAMALLAACSSQRGPGAESPSGSASTATTVFGNELSLTGYDIRTNGGHTELELRWSAVQQPTADYMVFVHALDGSGAIVFQGDHYLTDEAGSRTAAWKLGESVKDRFLMAPPPDRAGTYPLRLGVDVPSPLKVLLLSNSAFSQPAGPWRAQSIIIDHVDCK
jgi:hypothetical protein